MSAFERTLTLASPTCTRRPVVVDGKCSVDCPRQYRSMHQRCADMYPRIDILRISAILTDTDRIRIVISLLERIRIRILCHGYSTDMHYALVLFCLNLILCIVYIRRHTGHKHKMQLQVIELSNTEYRVIDASLMFWKDNCKQFP